MSPSFSTPNILILLTDQQRFDTIAAAGYPHMKTPNLDRLVREGCLFERAYSPNPICVPARHYLLTGCPASAHGYFDNSSHPIADSGLPTLPRLFSESGYYTSAIGKCHFHPPKAHHGYDETHLMEELPRHPGEDAYLQFLQSNGHGDLRNIHGIRSLLYHEPQRALVEEDYLGPRWVARRTRDWLQLNGDRPFLLTCNWIKPHPPWNIPEEREGMYEDAELPEPIQSPRINPFPTRESDFYGDHDSPEHRRTIREAYYTSISMVDEAVGEVLDTLEEIQQLDNTVIIFTSDHGEMLQDHGFYQKMLPFESSARIPLVIRYPKVFEPGSRRRDLVDLMDLFPTCLDLGGIDFYSNDANLGYSLTGGSLVPETHSPWKRDPGLQFCDCLNGRDRWVMLRDDRYKFIHFFAGGVEYLFDLENDPEEKENLLDAPSYPEDVYCRLRKKAMEYESRRGPGGTVRYGDFVDVVGSSRHEEFDWNNGAKFPKWCFGHFQRFGASDREWELFTREWKLATAGMPADWLAGIPLPEEGMRMMADDAASLGADPDHLLTDLNLK